MISIKELSLRTGISRHTLRARYKKFGIIPVYHNRNHWVTYEQAEEIGFDFNFERKFGHLLIGNYEILPSKMNKKQSIKYQ